MPRGIVRGVTPWLLTLVLGGPPADDPPPVQRPKALAPRPAKDATPEESPAAPAQPEPPTVDEPAPAPGAPTDDSNTSTDSPAIVPLGETEPDRSAPSPGPTESPSTTPSPSPGVPPPPRGNGTGLLIAAGGAATGTIGGRLLYGLAFASNVNNLPRDEAVRSYLFGNFVNIFAGATIGLGVASQMIRARRDVYQDVHVFRTGPRSRKAHMIAGWTLLGIGFGGWVATRAAAGAVTDACPRGECFVIYMESTWFGTFALSTAGAMLGAYGTHYTRLAAKSRAAPPFVVLPMVHDGLGGLSVAGRF